MTRSQQDEIVGPFVPDVNHELTAPTKSGGQAQVWVRDGELVFVDYRTTNASLQPDAPIEEQLRAAAHYAGFDISNWSMEPGQGKSLSAFQQHLGKRLTNDPYEGEPIVGAQISVGGTYRELLFREIVEDHAGQPGLSREQAQEKAKQAIECRLPGRAISFGQGEKGGIFDKSASWFVVNGSWGYLFEANVGPCVFNVDFVIDAMNGAVLASYPAHFGDPDYCIPGHKVPSPTPHIVKWTGTGNPTGSPA